MKSYQPLAQTRRLILLCAIVVLPACAGGPPIVGTPNVCSALLPAEWREAVPGAALPAGDQAGEWIAFADAQTGQLDKANDRTLASIGIIERCEARDRAVIERARRPWWQLW